jgi:hypothetical protein
MGGKILWQSGLTTDSLNGTMDIMKTLEINSRLNSFGSFYARIVGRRIDIDRSRPVLVVACDADSGSVYTEDASGINGRGTGESFTVYASQLVEI